MTTTTCVVVCLHVKIFGVSSVFMTMAQILIGKLLPNLKVTLGNDAEETDSSEVKEKTDEVFNDSKVEIVRSWMESLQSPKIYKNKDGGFTTGLDLISQENSEILDKRAERFGLEKEECALVPSLSSLYESMGINLENRHSTKMKHVRLEALHMRGIEELNTNDIFNYFKDYGPASVEWINDFSCNVVWLDETSCARALLGLSKPLPELKKNVPEGVTNEDIHSDNEHPDVSTMELNDDKEKEAMDTDDDHSKDKPSISEASLPLDIPIPPGYWRLGVPHEKAKTILLRFATKDDKKIPGAEKRSNYYKKYGNPNYGGLKGLISSSRKRKLQAAANRRVVEKGSSSFQVETEAVPNLQSAEFTRPRASSPKLPRMRMYADDEELKSLKSRSRDDFPEKRKTVHSRLGSKYTKDDLCHLGMDRKDSRDYESRNFTSRIPSGRKHSEWDSRKRSSEDETDLGMRDSEWNSRKRSPERQTDLRAKLRRLRDKDSYRKKRVEDRPRYNHREKRDRSDFVKKYGRIDELKEQDKTDYKRKHRSPLCADNEYSETSSSDE